MDSKHEELLVQYLNNDHVVKYLSSKIPQPYTKEDAKWWITTGSKENAIVKAIEFNGVFCGVIGVYTQSFEYQHSVEIGYWIAQAFWGKGIASEAVIKFTDFVLSQSHITRCYAPVFAENKASMRVLEKAGYELEGILKNAICKNHQYFDEYRFAKICL